MTSRFSKLISPHIPTHGRHLSYTTLRFSMLSLIPAATLDGFEGWIAAFQQ